jgi:mono/diheme cytochrome c family protein
MRTLLVFLAGLLLVPLLLLLAAAAGRLPVHATAEPPGLETRIGRMALHAGLGREARSLRNPVAAGDEAALAEGMRLFRMNCAGCHGDGAGPSPWGSKNFYPRVPQFAQEPVAISPEQAFLAIRDGVRYSGMGAWRGMMEEPEMWKVATFVSRIPALPPALRQRWRSKPGGK